MNSLYDSFISSFFGHTHALIEEMSSSFKVIAPDTLGFGDSVATTEWPSAGDYADSVIRVMDSLEIESCHFFGSHTGAHIASEVAIISRSCEKIGIGWNSDVW